jgi:hypothetical protein
MYFTLCLFHVCDPPSCSRPPFASENLFVGSVAAAAYNPPTSLPHLVFVDDNHINFSPVVVAVFLSLGLLSCSLFTQQPSRTNSPPPDLSTQGYLHWEAWDLLPDSLVGQVG